jgi:hypothetical protein
MHVRRLIALAAAALALASASSTLAAPLLAAAPEQLQPGVTTYSQVIAALGEPDSETMRTGGYRSTKYGVTSAHERLLTFVPLVKFFVERCKGCAATVVLTFNPAGVAVSYSMQRNSIEAPQPPPGPQPGQQAPEPKDNP